MSVLLQQAPYSERHEELFLNEINLLTEHHLAGCKAYGRICKGWRPARHIEESPFVHVGVFKRIELKTENDDLIFKRSAHSSSTSGTSSRIVLDQKSSNLQSESAAKILGDFLGDEKRPLLVLDSVKSLRRRGEMSARVAAAMSLQPLASDIVFLLQDAENPKSMKWDVLRDVLLKNEHFILYGFSWILWLAWGVAEFPQDIKALLRDKEISFVHSGGWKKLEAIKVQHDDFNTAVLRAVGKTSKVIDFYGLVEQMGIIYPMCEYGARHVPVWADVIIRDVYTLKPLMEETGQIQLLNVLAYGAPYHSVLTEDVGRLIPGECPCGRKGRRFDLIGRVPKAEIRGCANV